MDVTALRADAARAAQPVVAPTPKPAAQTAEGNVPKADLSSFANPGVPDKEALAKELDFANSVAGLFDKRVSFSYDDRLNQVVVTVVQNNTEEVIRQFPPEEIIALRLQLKDNFQGIILNKAG
jgi:flagellar protein FlaG